MCCLSYFVHPGSYISKGVSGCLHPMISKPRKPEARPLKTKALQVMVEPDFLSMIDELEAAVLNDWEKINGLSIGRSEIVRRSLRMFYMMKNRKE